MTTTSTTSRRFPTLRYLAAPFRWFFRSRRRVMTAAAVLVAMIIAPILWWSIQLTGLPDIGDPFDPQTLQSISIPEDRNAVVLYLRAKDRLRMLDPAKTSKNDPVNRHARWSKAAPSVRRWVEDNRDAMELYRQGSDRPDALGPHGPIRLNSYDLVVALGTLQELALLEASRLEDEGDLAGAWTWYRAALRAAHHLGRRGTMFDRMTAVRWQVEIRKRMDAWAEDRRTTPTMLRRALDDAIACEALAPSETYSLWVDYGIMETYLGRERSLGRQDLVNRLKAHRIGSTDYQLDPDFVRTIVDAWRFWRREPERSRRVLRLAIANWLAYYETPADRRPPPDPEVTGSEDFYAFGPAAPAGARALSPAALDRWLRSTSDARELLRAWNLRTVQIRERATHRDLVIFLASQLYRRDHGTGPPSDEVLVGPYLTRLPEDAYKKVGDAAGELPTGAVQ